MVVEEEEEGTKPIHRYIEYIPVCKYVYRLARVCNQMAGSCRVEDGEKSDEVRGRACRRCSTRRGKNKKVKPSFSIYEKKNYIGILSFKKKRGWGVLYCFDVQPVENWSYTMHTSSSCYCAMAFAKLNSIAAELWPVSSS